MEIQDRLRIILPAAALALLVCAPLAHGQALSENIESLRQRIEQDGSHRLAERHVLFIPGCFVPEVRMSKVPRSTAICVDPDTCREPLSLDKPLPDRAWQSRTRRSLDPR